MAGESRDSLARVRKGQKIKADTINILIDFCKANGLPDPYSISDGSGSIQRPIPAPDPDWVHVSVCDIDMDPFGIVAVKGTQWFDNHVAVHIGAVDENTRIFAANEDFELIAGTQGWVKLLDMRKPRRVRMTEGETVDLWDWLTVDEDGAVLHGYDHPLKAFMNSGGLLDDTMGVVYHPFTTLSGVTTGAAAFRSPVEVEVYQPNDRMAQTDVYADYVATGKMLNALTMYGAVDADVPVELSHNGTSWIAIVKPCDEDLAS